jgi:hypothetical protein
MSGFGHSWTGMATVGQVNALLGVADFGLRAGVSMVCCRIIGIS